MVDLTRRAALALAASSLALGIGARAALAEEVIIERVMPEVIVETPPPSPGARYAWVPGHWRWAAYQGRWVWVKGHYIVGVVPPMPAAIVEVQAPRPGPRWFWVRGHYVWERRAWLWVPGHWVRA